MKYGFIGCGNMGSAIVQALVKNTKSIIVSDRSGKAKAFAQSQGIAYGTAGEVCESERIFLAVKPQMLEAVLAPLKDTLAKKKPLIISMAAGVAISKIESMIGTSLPIIRIMPNTPVSVGQGLITYCYNDSVSDAVLKDFAADMCHCGILDAIPEALIDAASAVSGCGPAYMYMFIEALADGAVACGLPRAKATQYAAQTMLGSAEIVLKSGQHPGQLKDAVCSPGGSTIAGLKALEEKGFRGAAMDCIVAAYQRTKELGK